MVALGIRQVRLVGSTKGVTLVMVDLAAEVTVVAVAEEMAVRVAEVLGVGVHRKSIL